MGKRIRQILQDDPARDIRKAFLEHRAVMPNVPTNIDECWQLGIPVFRLGSNGVLIQPAPPDGLLHSHVADKSTHLQWVLGKPGVRVQIGVVSWLEYCVFTIGNILIFVRAQESGHFLEQRTAVLEAERAVNSQKSVQGGLAESLTSV